MISTGRIAVGIGSICMYPATNSINIGKLTEGQQLRETGLYTITQNLGVRGVVVIASHRQSELAIVRKYRYANTR